MKQVIFKKITIQNFLSIGNKPIEIEFKQGLNIITGTNFDKEGSTNGVGKSAIMGSVFFALFGNSLRDLKKDQIVNNINKKKCLVILEFDIIESGKKDEYVLTRGILPTKIELTKNTKDITESSIPKTTLQIQKIISSTPEVFENSVIMTIDNVVPFMAQGKVAKRKFIEGVLRLGVFSEMLLLTRQDYKDTKKDYTFENSKLSDIEQTYQNYIKYQNEQDQTKIDRISVLEDRQLNNFEELEILKPKLQTITKDELKTLQKNNKLLDKKESDCKTKVRKIVQTIATHEERIKHNIEIIHEIEELEKEEKCYTCLRPFETKTDISFIDKKLKQTENKNKKIEEKINNLNIELNEIESTQDKCLRLIEKNNKRIQEIKNQIRDNENISQRIKQLNNWNKQIKIDIKELNNQVNNFTDLINESKSRIDLINQNVSDYQTKLDILDVVKFIVSEEGVKSFIVKKILKILNGKLAYYLKEMEAPCTCMFNEYFEEVISNDKGQECSYYNFSSGERKRIDLAILFTFMDIRRLQGDVMINLSFYDEILDTSLDDIGINAFLDILQNRIEKYNEFVYIISHKDSAIKKATGEVIYLEKRNGFTSLLK